MARKSTPRDSSSPRPFSYGWLLTSMATFIGIEMLLGGLVGKYIVGRYVSISLGFTLQGLLNLSSYFLGGLLIGVVSPGVRILEPALGAACSVALMMVLTLFTPYGFMSMSPPKLLLGGIIAFFIALSGAKLGEKLAGNRM